MTRHTIREADVYLGGESTFSLDDDEMILDSEYRGPNRLVIAIATPTEHECGTRLDSGGRCSRTVESPDGTCFQHGDAE